MGKNTQRMFMLVVSAVAILMTACTKDDSLHSPDNRLSKVYRSEHYPLLINYDENGMLRTFVSPQPNAADIYNISGNPDEWYVEYQCIWVNNLLAKIRKASVGFEWDYQYESTFFYDEYRLDSVVIIDTSWNPIIVEDSVEAKLCTGETHCHLYYNDNGDVEKIVRKQEWNGYNKNGSIYHDVNYDIYKLKYKKGNISKITYELYDLDGTTPIETDFWYTVEGMEYDSHPNPMAQLPMAALIQLLYDDHCCYWNPFNDNTYLEGLADISTILLALGKNNITKFRGNEIKYKYKSNGYPVEIRHVNRSNRIGTYEYDGIDAAR